MIIGDLDDFYDSRATQLSNVKKTRIHEFRHFHASSQRLGHRKADETLNTYSHLSPSAQKEIEEFYYKKVTAVPSKALKALITLRSRSYVWRRWESNPRPETSIT